MNSILLKKVLQNYKKTTYSANYFIRLPKNHSQMALKYRKTCLVVKKTSRQRSYRQREALILNDLS